MPAAVNPTPRTAPYRRRKIKVGINQNPTVIKAIADNGPSTSMQASGHVTFDESDGERGSIFIKQFTLPKAG